MQLFKTKFFSFFFLKYYAMKVFRAIGLSILKNLEIKLWTANLASLNQCIFFVLHLQYIRVWYTLLCVFSPFFLSVDNKIKNAIQIINIINNDNYMKFILQEVKYKLSLSLLFFIDDTEKSVNHNF